MALSVRPQFNTWDREGQARSTLEAQFGFGQAVAENSVAGFLSSFGIGTLVREGITPQPVREYDPNAPLWTIPNPFSDAAKTAGAIGAVIRGDKPEPAITEEEFAASPDWRKQIPYETGMTKSRLAALAAQYDVAEARAMMSQKEWGGAFIGQFLGQMLDPINYVPFTGPAVQTAAVARAGGILGRIGVAATDAAISTAVFGAATAEWRRKFGDDISFEAMAQEIGMSMVIGGVFGAGLGVLSIPADRRMRDAAIIDAAATRMNSLRDVQGRQAILSDSTSRLAAGLEMNPAARVEFERQASKFQDEIRIQEERDIGRAVEARTVAQRAEIAAAKVELEAIPAETPRAVELSKRVMELEDYVQRVDTVYRAQRELVARGVAFEPDVAARAAEAPPVADGTTRLYTATDPAAGQPVAASVEAPANGDGWYMDVPTEQAAELTARPIEPPAAAKEGEQRPGVQPMAWQQLPKIEAPPVSPFRRLMINRFMEGGRSGEEGLALAKTFEAAYANLSARAGWTPERMLQEYPLPEVVYRGPERAPEPKAEEGVPVFDDGKPHFYDGPAENAPDGKPLASETEMLFEPPTQTLFQVSPEQARAIDMPVEMPADPLFTEAVANTDGASITEDGLLIDLVRYQKEEQSGSTSVRTGVFYLPVGSASAKHYKGGKYGYGGKVEVRGKTLIKHPIFVKGATGGKAPEAAFDAIKGKGAYEKMRTDVLAAISDKRMIDERGYNLLEEYGADGDLIWEIVPNSKEGNTLPYALQENIVAHAVREAGYDAVVGYSVGRGGKGAFLSEVFDVREVDYPTPGETAALHPQFEASYNQSAPPTDSPAFRAWFGDSKVVDADGKPLVVYHATGADFDAFNPSRGVTFLALTPSGAMKGAGGGSHDFQQKASADRILPLYVRAEAIEHTQPPQPVVDEIAALPDEISVVRYDELRAGRDGEFTRALSYAFSDNIERDGEWFVRKEMGNLFKPLQDVVRAGRDWNGQILPGYNTSIDADARMGKGLKNRGFDATLVSDESGIALVIADPTQIKSKFNRGTFDPNDPRILYQVSDDATLWEPDTGRNMDETPRGQIKFKDGKSLMTLFDGADPSTALHEAGHHFLMMIKDMGERTDTGPGIKEDWAQVKGWLAVNAKDVATEAGNDVTPDDVLAVLNRNTSGDKMKDIAINRGIHEQWARGFEAYHLEGKAPSAGMRGVFESFRKWLAAIYASVKSLNVNLTPEIRQVFDRLLTDEPTVERAVVTAPERPAGALTLDPPEPELPDAPLVEAGARAGKSEDVAGFEEQIGAKVDGSYNEEGDIDMLRSLGRVLPEEEAALKQADDGYKDAVAYEKAIKVALACVMP